MTPKAPPKASENGVVTSKFTLTLDALQLNIIHQFCVQGQFPSVELKTAAAALQGQVEQLVPQEA